MKLRQRVMLFFATAMALGAAVLYYASRYVLLSSFHQLETEQMRQDVGSAFAALEGEHLRLGATTDDYAYWDKIYNYMADPKNGDISGEFQNSQMEGLGLDLIAIFDTTGTIVFAKSVDRQKHQEAPVPVNFLQELFSRRQLQFKAIACAPQDGIVAFPDGAYLLSLRPIFTSQKTGEPRGEVMFARKFNDQMVDRITNLTRTSVAFSRGDALSLPRDYLQAPDVSSEASPRINIQTLSEQRIAGYVLLRDIFGAPLFILRVETPRGIYERGKFSQLYLFATAFAGALLTSLVIILFLQRSVLNPLNRLGNEVISIGKRKATSERVYVGGRDEFATLGDAINGMLEELEKTQKDFLLITENIHQVFWMRDAKSGRYEYVSSAFERIWERPCDSLIHEPKSWLDKLHPEDSPVIARTFSEQALAQKSEAYFRILAADGSVRWLWERTFPVMEVVSMGRRNTLLKFTRRSLKT